MSCHFVLQFQFSISGVPFSKWPKILFLFSSYHSSPLHKCLYQSASLSQEHRVNDQQWKPCCNPPSRGIQVLSSVYLLLYTIKGKWRDLPPDIHSNHWDLKASVSSSGPFFLILTPLSYYSPLDWMSYTEQDCRWTCVGGSLGLRGSLYYC